MKSVRRWAQLKGFEYVFFDDEIFERVPSWYRQKANNGIWLMTDLARLILAKELLAGEAERTIWVDADILVFDPDQFDIAITEESAFCKEVWIDRSPDSKKILHRHHVNNAVSVFLRDNHFLDFYIHACQSIVRSKEGQLNGLEVGTRFLTTLYEVLRFQTLTEVGTLSPTLSAEIAHGGDKASRIYINRMGGPIRAANL